VEVNIIHYANQLMVYAQLLDKCLPFFHFYTDTPLPDCHIKSTLNHRSV